MTKPFTGGCACGAIRYEIAADPLGSNDCQCRQCQYGSGTGHSSNLAFPSNAVTMQGSVTRWENVGDGGTVKSHAFCPTCGTPVYLTFPAMPDLFVIAVGSLDEPGRYQPQLVTWAAAAQPWDHVDPALPSFQRMPSA